MKTVAFRVGYAHVSNFTRAFARRFGAPPRRYAELAANPPGGRSPRTTAVRRTPRSRVGTGANIEDT
jgi:AraC-like DNA-binding protein